MVDYGGLVDSRRMNQADFEIAKKWNEEGVIEFGRVMFHDIWKWNTHYVILSADFAAKAQSLRLERFVRMHNKRTWKKTTEK